MNKSICNHCGKKSDVLYLFDWKSVNTKASYILCRFCYSLLYNIVDDFCRLGAPENALQDDIPYSEDK